MMLHAVALVDGNEAVIEVDRAGHDNRALRKQQARTFILWDFEIVGDHLELVTRHVEHGARVDGH